MPPGKQLDGLATSGIFCAVSAAMGAQPAGQIASCPGIQGTVAARQDVNGRLRGARLRKNLVGHKSMNVLRISIPPLPRFAATARRVLWKFAGFHRLASGDAEYLVFALGEAVANAIQHAGTRDAIEIRVSVEGDAVVARVADRGQGFAAPAGGPVALPSVLAEAGRGFAIMQRCTDFLDVSSKPGAGTVVTMGRFRRGPQEVGPLP